ncbi:MAG: SDR family NAD(P)-dependent oxidoreductase, partial [Acidobacteria bacterium]|nr:SDR family NAD(P)-dependent oxidoreductase [Acidobacteriota bacterium]
MAYFDLSGQTAIVTGAASGIGLAIAKRLANAGATVAVADMNIDAANAAAAQIPNAFAVQVDVADYASVEAAWAAVLARTGRIHILVNNAGVAGKAAPLW